MNGKKNIQTFFIFGLFILMFVLLLGIFVPFFTVLLWAALLYTLGNPLYRRVNSKIQKEKPFYELKRHFTAATFALGTFIVIIVPLIGIGILLAQQLMNFLQSLEQFITENPDFFSATDLGRHISDLFEKISLGNLHVNTLDLPQELAKIIQRYSLTILSASTRILSNIGQFGLSLVFTVFSLYFFYLDSPYLLSLFGKAIPINPRQMKALVAKFSEITRHLFSGYFLVALCQGLVAFLIMCAFRIDGALLFSVLLLFCSFIPIFGAATIWLPMGISLIFTQALWQGVLFLCLSGIFISLLDNLLRPFFLKDRIKIHPLIIFFSILGGVKLFGLNGLLLGPIIIILFFTILDMVTSASSESDDASPDEIELEL